VTELPRHVNGRGLARHYDQLRGHERVRLVLEARARDDEREAGRLVASCPMVRGRFGDPTYTDRFEASADLAVAVALHLAPRMAQVRMLAVTGDLVARAMTAGAAVASDKAGEAVDEAARPVFVDAFDTAAGQLRAEAAAVLQAFGDVCRQEMRLEPDTVLRAHLGPPLVDMLGLDELDAKPDKTALRQWRELFERTWRRRLGS
jgi:hypothetical protein